MRADAIMFLIIHKIYCTRAVFFLLQRARKGDLGLVERAVPLEKM